MVTLPLRVVLEQFRALDENTHIVVIHPNYTAQHTLFDALLRDAGTAYVRLNGRQLAKRDVLRQLEEVTAAQNLRLDDVRMLILDEPDHVQEGVLDALLSELAAPSRRIVLLPRAVPVSILNNARLRALTAFLPVDPALMLWDYARRSDTSSLLEVRAFGNGRVLLDGRVVDDWDGTLPRSLFFYLIDQGMTTRNQIFETFWPRLSVREATNVFHVTKRKISEVLGADLTIYWSGFYRISPNIELSYDAAIFNELLQRSAVAPDEDSIELLLRALSLYQAHFLGTVQADWAKARRLELMQTYGDALSALAKIYEKNGQVHDALGLYLRAFVTNRQREDIIASVMRLYHQLGLPQDALAAYEHLERELQAHLGVAPAPVLRELAASIRAQL